MGVLSGVQNARSLAGLIALCEAAGLGSSVRFVSAAVKEVAATARETSVVPGMRRAKSKLPFYAQPIDATNVASPDGDIEAGYVTTIETMAVNASEAYLAYVRDEDLLNQEIFGQLIPTLAQEDEFKDAIYWHVLDRLLRSRVTAFNSLQAWVDELAAA